MIERGAVWWADLRQPAGSEAGYRRPVVIVQTDSFNRSLIRTVIAVVLTSNLKLAAAPGNVLVPGRESRLPKDSVANISQIVTLDRRFLAEPCGRLGARTMNRLAHGLRLVLGL